MYIIYVIVVHYDIYGVENEVGKLHSSFTGNSKILYCIMAYVEYFSLCLLTALQYFERNEIRRYYSYALEEGYYRIRYG